MGFNRVNPAGRADSLCQWYREIADVRTHIDYGRSFSQKRAHYGNCRFAVLPVQLEAFPDIGAVDLRVVRVLGDRNKINKIIEKAIFIQRNERSMVNVRAMGMRRRLLGLL